MSEFDLIVAGGQIVTPHSTYPAAVHVKGGRIVKIAENPEGSADKTVDAGGLHVMAGFLDAHCHIMDPGYPECEDFIHGTGAAAKAGLTCIIDVPRHHPPIDSAKRVVEQRAYLADKGVVDYGVMAGVYPYNVEDVEAMWRAGAVGLKCFTVEIHETPPLMPGQLQRLFRLASGFGGAILIHAEDDSVVRANEALLRATGRKDYMVHAEMHTREAQELAVDSVCSVAEYALKPPARLVFAHISAPEGLRRIHKARMRGAPVYAETMGHYLTLTLDDLRRKGPWVKFAPTAREPETVEEMWRCLNKGMIHQISSDHAPQPDHIIAPGEKDIWASPLVTGANIEVNTRLMLNAVSEGRTDLQRLARILSAGPARHYGLYPRKGAVQVGSDADLVVVDMNRAETMEKGKLVSKGGWTMHDGKPLKGAPVMTFVRGKLVYEEGKVVGEPGWGRFVTSH